MVKKTEEEEIQLICHTKFIAYHCQGVAAAFSLLLLFVVT
jgi:hypothetical protein